MQHPGQLKMMWRFRFLDRSYLRMFRSELAVRASFHNHVRVFKQHYKLGNIVFLRFGLYSKTNCVSRITDVRDEPARPGYYAFLRLIFQTNEKLLTRL